jgi:aminoglycoside 3-N-acetyltransferase I
MSAIQVRRFGGDDVGNARQLFTMMADVFEEQCRPLGNVYLERLLARDEFWALAAFVGDEMVGGLTAHTLPMTRDEAFEVFIYDIAVRADRQRQGVGRALIDALRLMASRQGIDDVFVAADADDPSAIDFYRALGTNESMATVFAFARIVGRSVRNADRIE